MTVADRIGVMNGGQLAQVATPSGIYEHPNSRWVAGFIGDVNLIEGRIVVSGDGHTEIDSSETGRVRVNGSVEAPVGAMAAVAVRPEKIQIDAAGSSPGGNSFAGQVEEIGYLGSRSIYKIRLDNGLNWLASMANHARQAGPAFAAGDRVRLSFAPEAGVVLLQ